MFCTEDHNRQQKWVSMETGIMERRNFSLILKIVLATTLVLCVLLALLGVFSERNTERAITNGLMREAETVMSLVPAAYAGPLFDYDYDQVESLAEQMHQNEIIAGIRILEGDEVIAESFDEEIDAESTFTRAQEVIGTDTYGDDISLGSVEIIFTTSVVEPEVAAARQFVFTAYPIIIIVIILLNIVMLLRIVSRPIRQTSMRMKEIAEGDADLTNRLVVRSRDEVGQLARYFNEFLQNLDVLVVEIRSSLDRTLNIQSELGANTDETVTALNQMTSNIESTRKQMAILTETIATSTDTVQEIVGRIEEMMDGVESQGTMVEQTTASVSELLASIDNVAKIANQQKVSSGTLVRTARDGGERLTETASVISGIERNIDEIREMLSLINGIASQTNLLAMNAAIEAAHAGDAGRGFAVVAEEIRKLAEDSSENSTRIAGVLGQIIDGIQNAASMSTETNEAFAEIDREVTHTVSALEEISVSMSEMNSGSREIHDAVGNLNTVSQRLVDGAKSIRSGSSSVLDAMKQIEDVSRVVDSAMTEIGQGTAEINIAMRHVADMNSELGSNARELDDKMTRFRTSQPAGVVAGDSADLIDDGVEQTPDGASAS